jgi:plasmid stabilization system protein ParE
MTRVVLASLASLDQTYSLADLNTKAGKLTAEKFRRLFSALFRRLSDHPYSGVVRPDLGPNIRIGVVKHFVIIYRYREDDDVVTVLRLIDGRQDISKRLLSDRQ